MYYIGIDLGGTSIKAGIVNQQGNIIKSSSIRTGQERGYKAVISDMMNVCKGLLDETNIKAEQICSIGLGSPGIPDKKRGVLLFSNNLGFKNTPFKDEIQKYFDVPVYLENDANVAALAESVAGASKNVNQSVMMTLGTGIGGGIIINNKIISGFNDAGSELGHMVIVHDGIQCSCGRKGCFEKYASASALVSQTKQAGIKYPNSKINEISKGDIKNINARTVFAAQKLGDEIADKVISKYLDYLAEGVMNIINILFPEIIVIGGGLGNEGENLFVPLRKRLKKMEYTNDVPHTRIVGAVMGNKAGIIGAAMLGKFI